MNPMDSVNYLNVGCGNYYHSAWTNIDLYSTSPQVRAWDLRNGLPYSAAQFEACYCSHVLEHLAPDGARALVAEMYRVLKPGGILRLVVPDLEAIARLYLQKLDAVAANPKEAAAASDYDWMLLELYDQTVRSESGGEMARYWRERLTENREFVLSRAGPDALAYLKAIQQPRSMSARLRSKSLGEMIRLVRLRLAGMCVRVVGGAGASRMFREGVFRNSGEIHRWMYDRVSLARMLAQAGFQSIRVCTAGESRIAGFDRFELDCVGGVVRKPDSLFIEAQR